MYNFGWPRLSGLHPGISVKVIKQIIGSVSQVFVFVLKRKNIEVIGGCHESRRFSIHTNCLPTVTVIVLPDDESQYHSVDLISLYHIRDPKGGAIEHSVVCSCGLNGEDVPSRGPKSVEMIGKGSVEGIIGGISSMRDDASVNKGPYFCKVGTAHVSEALPRHLPGADQEDQEEKGKSTLLFLHKKQL